MYKLILCDLDGTLLRRNKSISDYTLSVLRRCREMGILLGIATSRSALNAAQFISAIEPEVVISSGGAVAAIGSETVYYCGFSADETEAVIRSAKELAPCEITVDAEEGHFASCIKGNDLSWSKSILTDFEGFKMPSHKICVKLKDPDIALKIAESVPDCRCVKFTRSNWYMFTKAAATKEAAAEEVVKRLGIELSEVIAFGDDVSDIGLMRACGLGVATANAFKKAKKAADVLAGNCDEDGVAAFLEAEVLR